MKDFKTLYMFNSIDLSEADLDKEFELISTAKQTDLRYGEFQFSKADLEEMASNFNNEIVGTDIPVDENHDRNHKALAWLKNGSMRVAKSEKLKGQYSLYSKIDKHTPIGKEAMETGAYRYFSLQIQHRFEKMVNGVKKIFSNVVRSLALTNQPVIKDLAPTFSENFLFSNSEYNMELAQFIALADNFLKEEKVSQSQITTLKTLAEGLEGDDKVAADAKVVEAEAKVEKADDAKKTDDDAKKADDDKKVADDAAKELAEKMNGKNSFTLSDVEDIIKTTLAPVSKKLGEVMSEAREKTLSSQVSSLCLSEDNNIGFKADAKAGIVEFVKTLSDVQAKAYFELHQNILESVDLGEYGGADKGEAGDASEKATSLANEMVKTEKITFSEAMEKVLENDVELAEKASKGKQY